jgi:signal peptidase I
MNKTREGLIYFSNIAYELGKWAFVILLVGTILHYFVATIFVISGPSMETSFHNNQVVLVSRLGLFTGSYHRGDAMVIKFPGDPDHKKYIKRLIGLPGETLEIKDNRVYINGTLLQEPYIQYIGAAIENDWPVFYENDEDAQQALDLHAQGRALTKPDMKVTLGPDDYFFMGDNRENSNDSRKWYPAHKNDIVGPVRFILWPFKDWGPVVNPYYSS